MNVFTCACLWLLVVHESSLNSPSKAYFSFPIISNTFTSWKWQHRSWLFCDMLVYCFSRSFLMEEPFLYDIFLKIKLFLKHHWYFMFCLVLMVLLTHVALFTSCSWWCGWVYSDLHFVYRKVLLNWSSLKSSIARIENEQCCCRYVSLILFFLFFSCMLFSIMKETSHTMQQTSPLSSHSSSTSRKWNSLNFEV